MRVKLNDDYERGKQDTLATLRARIEARWQESERVPVSAVLNLLDVAVIDQLTQEQ